MEETGLFLAFAGSGGGQLAACGGGEAREVVAVVNVGDVEVVFGTWVGCSQHLFAQQGAAGGGGLHEKAVVAYQPEDFAIAIDAVVAKHLFGDYVAGAAALVGNILHEVAVGGHIIRLLVLVRG